MIEMSKTIQNVKTEFNKLIETLKRTQAEMKIELKQNKEKIKPNQNMQRKPTN